MCVQQTYRSCLFLSQAMKKAILRQKLIQTFKTFDFNHQIFIGLL
jgi:hypothetical protein